MLRNQSRDCSFCRCLFAATGKKWVTLELLRIMWLTCLSIFHLITQGMACPRPLCGLGLVCCCSPELMGDAFCAGRSTQPAAHSFYPAEGQGPAKVLPHVADEWMRKGSGGAGVSVSLRARGRDASGALSSGGHLGGLSPETHPGFLLRSACCWGKVKTPLQYTASDHAELLLKQLKCLVVLYYFSGSSIVMMSPAAVGILDPPCLAKCLGAPCLAVSVVLMSSSAMRLMWWSVQWMNLTSKKMISFWHLKATV